MNRHDVLQRSRALWSTVFRSRRSVFKRIKSATVAICVRKSNTLVPFGSGINVHPKGFIVTAKHVVDATLAHPIPRSEQLSTGSIVHEQLWAVFCVEDQGSLVLTALSPPVMGGLHSHDLAFLKLRLGSEMQHESLPSVLTGDSDAVFEGEEVVTCGFPLGQLLQPALPTGSLFQAGIVSSIRPHALAKRRELFYLDMTINPGNSGGPLCSEATAALVGIVNARIEDPQPVPTGISCAVPINLVKANIEEFAAMSVDELEQVIERRMREAEVSRLSR